MLPLPRSSSVQGFGRSGPDRIFDIRVRSRGPGHALIQLRGELDITSTELFEAVLCSHCGRRDLYLDLAELSFLDCAGVDAMLAVHQRQASRSGRLVLLHARPAIRRLLHLTHADRVLPLADAAPPTHPGPST